MRRSARATTWCAGLVALVAGIAPALLTAGGAGATPAMLHSGTGLSTNYDFARLVLLDGGWPVSPNNVTVLTQWLRSEEPPSRWWNRNNPLNNGLGSGGGSGLGSYGTVVTAAYFVAENLKDTAYGYPAITRDLRVSAPVTKTDRAIWRSSWASGHYGRGAFWNTSPVPSVTAPPSSWRNPADCPIPYPSGVVGPCGRWFSTTGTMWRSGAPAGIRGQELWAFSGRAAGQGAATWSPRLVRGTYRVEAFLPALFDDADVTYVVIDARGGHRVPIDQEPYSNQWVSLGNFTGVGGSSLRVTLSTAARGPSGATYVAADAMRFVRSSTRAHVELRAGRALDGRMRRPGRPLDLTAVAGNGRAVVSWLPPSKDGGASITRFSVVSLPRGRTCVALARGPGEYSCTVRGLGNGASYTFVARAVNRFGRGMASSPTSTVRPLGAPSIRIVVVARKLEFGSRVIYRVLASSKASGGSILFAQDGRVIPGCQNVHVVKGRASCAVRLTSAARHVIFATFSGNAVLTGSQNALPIAVPKAPTALRAAPVKRSVVVGTKVTLRAWHLPARAAGKVVFAAGSVRLCVAVVRSGGGTCSTILHLTSGPHDVTASYLGDRSFLDSLARTTLNVLPAAGSAAHGTT